MMKERSVVATRREGFAHAGKSAADNDDLGMEEMNDVRKSKRQVFPGFLDNSPGGGVILLEGGAEVGGFATDLAAGQLAKEAGGSLVLSARILADRLPNRSRGLRVVP